MKGFTLSKMTTVRKTRNTCNPGNWMNIQIHDGPWKNLSPGFKQIRLVTVGFSFFLLCVKLMYPNPIFSTALIIDSCHEKNPQIMRFSPWFQKLSSFTTHPGRPKKPTHLSWTHEPFFVARVVSPIWNHGDLRYPPRCHPPPQEIRPY